MDRQRPDGRVAQRAGGSPDAPVVGALEHPGVAGAGVERARADGIDGQAANSEVRQPIVDRAPGAGAVGGFQDPVAVRGDVQRRGNQWVDDQVERLSPGKARAGVAPGLAAVDTLEHLGGGAGVEHQGIRGIHGQRVALVIGEPGVGHAPALPPIHAFEHAAPERGRVDDVGILPVHDGAHHQAAVRAVRAPDVDPRHRCRRQQRARQHQHHECSPHGLPPADTRLSATDELY